MFVILIVNPVESSTNRPEREHVESMLGLEVFSVSARHVEGEIECASLVMKRHWANRLRSSSTRLPRFEHENTDAILTRLTHAHHQRQTVQGCIAALKKETL